MFKVGDIILFGKKLTVINNIERHIIEFDPINPVEYFGEIKACVEFHTDLTVLGQSKLIKILYGVDNV